MYPFCHGLPGSMNNVFTPSLSSHFLTALAVNYGPLSERICSGTPFLTNSFAKHGITSPAPDRGLIPGARQEEADSPCCRLLSSHQSDRMSYRSSISTLASWSRGLSPILPRRNSIAFSSCMSRPAFSISGGLSTWMSGMAPRLSS